MGVMPCRRRGCKSVMCDRLSNDYGYICDECFDELVLSGLHPLAFMDTYKKSTLKYNVEMLEEEFSRI